MQTGIEKNVIGNNPVSLTVRPISSEVTKDDVGNGSAKPSSIDNVEIDVPNSSNHFRSPTSDVVSTFCMLIFILPALFSFSSMYVHVHACATVWYLLTLIQMGSAG